MTEVLVSVEFLVRFWFSAFTIWQHTAEMCIFGMWCKRLSWLFVDMKDCFFNLQFRVLTKLDIHYKENMSTASLLGLKVDGICICSGPAGKIGLEESKKSIRTKGSRAWAGRWSEWVTSAIWLGRDCPRVLRLPSCPLPVQWWADLGNITVCLN